MNWYLNAKFAMPQWWEMKPTVTLFHGTSSALVPAIQSEGLKPPDESLDEYARRVASKYLNPLPLEVWKMIETHTLSLRRDVNGHQIGHAIYLSPTFQTASDYAKSYAEMGGEIAFEIYKFCNGYAKKNSQPQITPAFAGAKPVVVEVEVPHDWMKTYHNLPEMKTRAEEYWKEPDDYGYPRKEKSLNEFMGTKMSKFEVRVTQPIPAAMIKAVHPVGKDQ